MSYLAISEASEIIRVSRWTVMRLIEADEIAARKRDPRVRSSAVDIDTRSVGAFIWRHTVPAPDQTEDPLMSGDKPGRLLFLEEVAEETGLPLKTLKLGCRSGEIRHVRFGRKPQMTREQIAELIETHTTGGRLADVSDPETDADRARVARMAAAAST